MNTIPRVRMSADSFIYACHVADTARHKRNGTFNSHLRFDPFLMGTFEPPLQPDLRKLKGLVLDILKHHAQISPQFRRNEDIDLESISYFTNAITTLFADLDTLFKHLTGEGLPRIPVDPPEYSTAYPMLASALAKWQDYQRDETPEKEPYSLLPLDPEADPGINGADPGEVYACEVWDLVSESLNPVFPEHADAIMSYAFWKFQPEPEREPIDWRVRPPVGEAFAKHFRMSGGRGGPRGKGGRDFDRKGGGRGDRGDRGDRRDRGDRAPRAEGREGRPPFEEKERNGEGRAGGSSRAMTRNQVRPSSDRGPAQITGEEDLEKALQEARDAIESLKNNPTLSEVALAPGNSYIRRQQHALITEMGFGTESRGEGKGRSVFVKRGADA